MIICDIKHVPVIMSICVDGIKMSYLVGAEWSTHAVIK